MKSRNLTVIHLSDLHFSGGAYRPVFEKLIKDVAQQIKDDEDVLIVVSGDLVSKGEIDANSKNVVDFFERLRRAIPSEALFHGIEIVPGNHDLQRTLAKKGSSYEYFQDKTKYLRLAKRVYKAMNVRPKTAYGSTVLDFHGRRIHIARLDTSWFELPSNLKKQIESEAAGVKSSKCDVKSIYQLYTNRLSENFKTQGQRLSLQYTLDVAKNNHVEPAISIILAHHPLSVLNATGYDLPDDMLFRNGLEFGDVWMCGHMHFAQHYFTSDNTRQRIMLTTGMGWQDSQHEQLRYSIYRMNLDRNTCQVSIRSSVSNEDFRADGTSGSNYEFSLYGHITLPLRLKSVGAAIHANSVPGKHPSCVFVDVPLVESIPSVLKEFRKAQIRLLSRIEGYEREAKEAVLRKGYSVGGILKRLRSVFSPNIVDIETGLSNKVVRHLNKKHMLSKFIEEICVELSSLLKNIASIEQVEDKSGVPVAGINIRWRAHTRSYLGRTLKKFDKKKDVYKAKEWLDVEGERCSQEPSDVSWGSLIKSASDHPKKILINSANPRINSHETEWSDFATFVPADSRLYKIFPTREKRPLVSFGISFCSDDYNSLKAATRTLYLVEYLGISDLVNEMLVAYIERFNLTGKDVLLQIK